MTVTKRLLYLDNIKGVLIILVVVGHAIQYCSPTYEMNFAFRFIYSFHMPLFFFVSGYLANRGRWDNNVIQRRAVQLLIPFVAWAFVDPLLKTGSMDVVISLRTLIYPDKGLWFLYNLFIYSVIFNIAEFLYIRFGVKHWLVTGIFYILLGILMLLFKTKFNCSQLCYHIIFYAAGYYYRQLKIIDKYTNLKVGILGVTFLLTVPFWVTNGVPLFYDQFNLGGIFAYIYRYGVQIVGMMFFYGLGYKLLNKEIPMLQKLGTATLGIYAVQFIVIHYYVKLLLIDNVSLKIVSISVLTVPTSYLFVWMVRKVKCLKLLIGEK